MRSIQMMLVFLICFTVISLWQIKFYIFDIQQDLMFLKQENH